MAQLFTKLTEEFDGTSGTLINYVSLAGTPLGTRRHYDIRSFIGDDITVPNTMLDLRYNNVFGLDGEQMIVLDAPRIVSGRTIAARPIANFNGVQLGTMDTFQMLDLDVYTLSTGGENWPIDPAVTVGKDSTERWANSIRVTLPSSSTLGTTTVGANWDLLAANYKQVAQIVPTSTIAFSSINLYVRNTTSSPQVIRPVVYDNSAGAPNNLLLEGPEFTIAANLTAQWINIPLGQPIVLSPGTYYIGFFGGDTQGAEFAFDHVSNTRWYAFDLYNDGLSGTFGSPTQDDNKISIYVDTSLSVTSLTTDNIYSGMESNASTYYIELALPGFPAQAAGSHLDLDNSYIDFTSDTSGNFAVGLTNSFKFSDSLHSLTAGGNTYWQINRNSLTNVDIKNITGVRFRLKSVGAMTFKAQALRVYKADEYTFDSVDTETKRGQFKRSVPRDSGAEPATPTISTYMMNDTRPKNITLVAKINSGHIDTANDSSFSLIIRNTDASNYITGNILVNNSRTQLNLTQTVNGVTTSLNQTNLSALTGENYYLLMLEAYESQVRLSLYTTYGAFYGTLLGTTAYRTTTLVQRGRVGFDFKPYDYDFLIDYITTSDAEFARFESKSFASIKPVIGATVASESSPSVDLTASHFIPAGDAVIDTDPQVGEPAPSIKFTRDGSNWQGGYMTDGFIFIGNPKYLKISGDVYPVLATGQSSVRGTFRVVFIDKWDSVGYISYIRNLLPSQWNHFDIPLNSTSLAPGNYRILIQQTGFFDDVFYLDNLSVNHLSFSWEASPDAGTNWYKFLTAIDEPYSAVNFKDNPGNSLKIRATALSDDVWISNYEIVPLYGIPGQTAQVTPGAHFSSNAYDVRLIGQGTSISRVQEARISGVANPGAVVRDVRLTGQGISNSVTNARITATAGVIRVNDARITGQSSSNVAYNVRTFGINTSSYSVSVRLNTGTATGYQGLLALMSDSGGLTSPYSYSYQWQRADNSGFTTNVTNITGATSSTDTTTSSDISKYIRVGVTATNTTTGASSSPAYSNIIGPIS